MAETEVAAQNAEFTEAEDAGGAPSEENLDVLLDINMPITVNIGSTEVPFKRLLQLGPGSVLQLDKTIGQPAELRVQDIKFATGDIVVVDGGLTQHLDSQRLHDPPGEAAGSSWKKYFGIRGGIEGFH